MKMILSTLFRLLYHELSWVYDFVAAFVSAGHWRHWVSSVIPFLQGPRILELGFGPGHLQVEMAKAGFLVYGIDESKQMLRQAKNRLLHNLPKDVLIGYAHIPCLNRALAQHLPFHYQSFDTIVATFPSPYIFDPLSLAEIHRVLKKDGKLIVLLSAKTAEITWFDRISNNIFQLTGQALPNDTSVLVPFLRANFRTEARLVRSPYGEVSLIIATKLETI